jgi:membrane-bound lytic murein transglycosylase D
MRAANQRPILTLGTAIVLWGLAGCAPAVRPGTVSLAPPAGPPSATYAPTAEPGDPVDPGPVASPHEARGGLADSEPEFLSSHPRVQDFVDRYQTTLREFMQRALQRGSKYLPRMARVLSEEGVPPELAYLPIVESGFSLHAVSHAGAVGPWQFMRHTGRRYGLRIDGYVDERRDPEMATRAAARYLRDLYELFGDWHLALAGYNTGEGAIQRIQSWKGCGDFWEMSDRGYLSNETSEFVPRVLAAVEVGMAAEEYGFDVPVATPTRFDTIEITRPISLKAVARLSGSDEQTLRELNPALNRGVVPPHGYAVRLPKGTREQFEIALASYREPERPVLRPRAARSHKVQRGETLAKIAKRYRVSLTALRRANGLRTGSVLKAGQTLRIPAMPGRSHVVASVPKSSRYN